MTLIATSISSANDVVPLAMLYGKIFIPIISLIFVIIKNMLKKVHIINPKLPTYVRIRNGTVENDVIPFRA